MKWNEARLDMAVGEVALFAFCGIGSREARNGKTFEVIKVDRDMSYWLPLFAVTEANISIEEARKFKGTVEISAQVDNKYKLRFIAA